MAGYEPLTESDRKLQFCTTDDENHRALLLQALVSQGVQSDSATFQLMSQLGKAAHIGMHYCYEKYVGTQSSLTAKKLLQTKNELRRLLIELVRVVGTDESPQALQILETNSLLLKSKTLSHDLLSKQIQYVSRYIKKSPGATHSLSRFWSGEVFLPAVDQSDSSLLPTDFVRFVEMVQTRLEKHITSINQGDLPVNIEALVACAFLLPYVDSNTEHKTLIAAVSLQTDDAHAIELEAENLLDAAINIESALSANNSEYCDYTQASSIEPSFFAARIALAAMWLKNCPGYLTVRLISAFFKNKKASVEMLTKFTGDFSENNRDHDPVSSHIMRALFDGENERLKLDYQTDYTNAEYIDMNGRGEVNTRCRAIFCSGQTTFLSDVYANLLNSEQTANAAQIALASKLAFSSGRLPPTFYEPPSITPNNISKAGKHAASKLLENVFTPLLSRLNAQQGCAKNPPIVKMVQEIYFSDAACSQAQPGFDWTKPPKKDSKKWLEIKSDDHLAKRRDDGAWGGPHLWLYGKIFAESLERAVSKAEAEHCNHGFGEQSGRLARFIFLVPKPRTRTGVPNSTIYELEDYSLVRGEIQAVVLALARRVVRLMPAFNLQALYQPIYDSAHVIADSNPFYGRAGAAL